jgi:hypothetical protein
MDFNQAVAAHSAWKRTLAGYLAKRDGTLSPARIALDDQCILGGWIHGEGRIYENLPEYSVLMREHLRFHRAAAEVVRRANLGQSAGEEANIRSGSEFALASTAIVLAIMDMQKHQAE